MTISKKTMTMLTLIMAVGAISMTYAATSFVGDDCSRYDENRMNGKACNDINDLNDRLLTEESKMPYVNTMTFTFSNTGVQAFTVSCDDNDVILSGGYLFNDTSDVNVYQNIPSSNSNSWEIKYTNNILAGIQMVKVYAVCLEVP